MEAGAGIGSQPRPRRALSGIRLAAVLSAAGLAGIGIGIGLHRVLHGSTQSVPLARPAPTVWLKRHTSQNIVIGGAAGAFPPLAGWAAAQGRIGLGALFLFAIVLLWTPPHFWALAVLIAPGYAAAGVPMLPVVRGPGVTAAQVLLYSIGLVAVTLVPALLGTFGLVYLCAALLLGAVLCALAWRLWREHTSANAALLFHYSLLYLALLFVAVAIDATIR